MSDLDFEILMSRLDWLVSIIYTKILTLNIKITNMGCLQKIIENL